jgi:hypothetical protein
MDVDLTIARKPRLLKTAKSCFNFKIFINKIQINFLNKIDLPLIYQNK